MAIARRAISLDPKLDDEIRRAAKDEGVSVSRWLCSAAEKQLKLRKLAEAVAKYEAEFGEFTEEEKEEARRLWPD